MEAKIKIMLVSKKSLWPNQETCATKEQIEL